MQSYNIWSCVASFFHLAGFKGSPMGSSFCQRVLSLYLNKATFLHWKQNFKRFTHVVVACINNTILQLNYILFTHLSISRYLSPSHFLAFYDRCCYKHSCANFCLDRFLFFWIIPRNGVAGSMFNYLSNWQDYLPQQLHHFTISSVVYEGSHFATSCP